LLPSNATHNAQTNQTARAFFHNISLWSLLVHILASFHLFYKVIISPDSRRTRRGGQEEKKAADPIKLEPKLDV
jgi:hypothetical protein